MRVFSSTLTGNASGVGRNEGDGWLMADAEMERFERSGKVSGAVGRADGDGG